MGVVNVQNYVKENQRNQLTSHTLSAGGNERHIEEGEHNESVNTALNPDKVTEETKTGNASMQSQAPKVQTPIMTPPDIEISRAATRLTADTGIVFRPLGGQKFHEREIIDIIKEYNTKLKDSLRSSFAPPELLVQNAMANYDPQFLFLVTNNNQKPIMERVKGLVVFSQDTTVKSEPITNEEDASMDIKRETKVLLHQLSAVDEELQEEIMDLGLDYIWKTMHC